MFFYNDNFNFMTPITGEPKQDHLRGLFFIAIHTLAFFIGVLLCALLGVVFNSILP